MGAGSDRAGKRRVLIWDLPTRVFHWLIVLAFAVGWISHDDDRFMYVHVFSGYSFLGLLVFRLLWGGIGTRYARFHSFAHDWKSVSAYLWGLLNGRAMRYLGHNPAGGWAIFLMILTGLLLGVTGVLVLGGEEGHGPLRHVVSYTVGIRARDAHEVLAWSLLGLVIVHLGAIVLETIVHRDNLIWAMITGYKTADPASSGVRGHHLLGSLLIAVLAVSALFYFRGYLLETADNLYQPYQGPELPDNALWREECGDCHFAFHPNLLPERSWRRIFAQQHDHFGEDLDLDGDVLKELLDFHVEYASESLLSEPARKILFYTRADEVPLRITDTRYWKDKHAEIDASYWKAPKVKSKSNCQACHLDAEQGTYEDSNMRLPK